MIADPTNIEPIPGLGEPLSALSHLLAALVFLTLTPRLIKNAGRQPSHIIAVSLFAFACVFQLAMSGVSHQLEPGSLGNQILLRLDHAAIFFLIASTYTPIHIILFQGFLRWGFLSFIWIAAIIGITFKSIFFDHTPHWLGLSLYLGLGWTGLFTGFFLWKHHGFQFMAPLLYGGIAYSLGVAIEVLFAIMNTFQPVPGILGGHELFHVAVLTGMGIHWKFIAKFSRENSHQPHATEQPLRQHPHRSP